MTAGRPTGFNQEIASIICERIADGESLRSICADDDMPSKSSVFKWLSEHKEFSDQYARSRETQADAIFDEIIDIADTPMIGEKTKVTSGGKIETTTGDMIEHRRLQVDARKWMAGKLRPKKYGEKLQHTGADGESPVQIETTDMTDTERARRVAFALAQAANVGSS